MRSAAAREIGLVALATLIGAVIFTWPLATDPGGSVVSYTDAVYNAWVLGWVADRAGHGLKDLWNAPVFFPYVDTLRYVEPLLGIGLPLAPVYWLTGNPLLLHNVATWLSFAVSGTGGYVLGRDLSRSRAAGVVAAAVAAFLPYRLSHLVHVQVLMAGWLWWTTWAVHAYFAAPSWKAAARAAAFYVLLGMSSLYWAYVGLIPMGVIVAVECWRRRPTLEPLARHGACAALIVAVAFVPVAMSVGHVASRDSPLMNAMESRARGADLMAYVSGRPTLLVWGDVLRGSETGETDLFPGLTALGCALASALGFRSRKRSGHDNSWAPVYAVLLVTGVALSLGPALTVGGRELLRNPVFDWVSPYVPGFAQLRAIARFVVVAQLGLSVLAAYGVAAWLEWRRASPREERLTAGILATLIFVEGLGVPLTLQPFSPYAAPGDRFTYFWLSRRPGGPLLELPLEGWSQARYGIYYQYRTLLHGHAIVNGVGRFRPPLLDMLGDPDSPVMAPSRAGEAVTLLRAIGVRYVVLHRKWFQDKALGDAIRTGFVAAVGPPAAEFGDSTIVDLGDGDRRSEPLRPAAPVREVPRELLTLSAMRGNTTAMIDGNPATRWLSARPQDGTEWIEIGLPSTVQVTGLRLQLMGRSLNDYPRGLDVSISPGDGGFRSVFASGVLPQLGAGLRTSPASPVIEIRWPAVAARVIRLRQTGRSARWYWSVHEIAVLSVP